MRNESRNQQTYDKSYQEAPVELESRWTASFAQVCAIPTCHLVLYSSGTRIVPTNRGSRGIRRTRHRARRTSRKTTRRYAFDTLQFTEFRTSLCVSQLAASFTATRAKTSTAASGRCNGATESQTAENRGSTTSVGPRRKDAPPERVTQYFRELACDRQHRESIWVWNHMCE